MYKFVFSILQSWRVLLRYLDLKCNFMTSKCKFYLKKESNKPENIPPGRCLCGAGSPKKL